MNKKEKNTRICTFKEDYKSKAGDKVGEVIYRKGETHAIHHLTVKSLLTKGAKMDVKNLNPDPIVSRMKKQLKESQKNSEATK